MKQAAKQAFLHAFVAPGEGGLMKLFPRDHMVARPGFVPSLVLRMPQVGRQAARPFQIGILNLGDSTSLFNAIPGLPSSPLSCPRQLMFTHSHFEIWLAVGAACPSSARQLGGRIQYVSLDMWTYLKL